MRRSLGRRVLAPACRARGFTQASAACHALLLGLASAVSGQVTETYPARHSLDARTTDSLVVTFAQQLPAAVPDSAVLVLGSLRGRYAVTVSRSSPTTLTIRSRRDFLVGERIQVTLRAPLDPYAWSFWVSPSRPTSPPLSFHDIAFLGLVDPARATDQLVPADLDGNGVVDLIRLDPDSLWIYRAVVDTVRSGCSFYFNRETSRDLGAGPNDVNRRLLAVDLDLDGRIDLAILRQEETGFRILVFRNTTPPAGSIDFDPCPPTVVNRDGLDMACEDFDLDAWPDLLVASGRGEQGQLFRNAGACSLIVPSEPIRCPPETSGATTVAGLPWTGQHLLSGDIVPDPVGRPDYILRWRRDVIGLGLQRVDLGPPVGCLRISSRDLNRVVIGPFAAAGAGVGRELDVLAWPDVTVSSRVFAFYNREPVDYDFGDYERDHLGDPVDLLVADLDGRPGGGGARSVEIVAAYPPIGTERQYAIHWDTQLRDPLSQPWSLADPAGSTPSAMAGADFDANGAIDFVVAYREQSFLRLFLQDSVETCLRSEPIAVDFGRVNVCGGESLRTITIRNEGICPLTLEIRPRSIEPLDAGFVLCDVNDPVTLRPGHSFPVCVRFRPGVELLAGQECRSLRAVLLVGSDYPCHTAVVELSGEACLNPWMLPQDTIAFQASQCGPPVERRFPLCSTAAGTTQVCIPAPGGPFDRRLVVLPLDAQGCVDLPPSPFCDTLVVRFDPRSGSATGTLQIRGTCFKEENIPLQGDAWLETIAAIPPGIVFPPIPPTPTCGDPASASLTLTNSTLYPIAVQASVRIPFAVAKPVGGACPAAAGSTGWSRSLGDTIPPGGQKRLCVRFAPSGPGSFQDTVFVAGDCIQRLRIPVSGSAVLHQLQISLATPVDMGLHVLPCSVPAEQRFTLTNPDSLRPLDVCIVGDSVFYARRCQGTVRSTPDTLCLLLPPERADTLCLAFGPRGEGFRSGTVRFQGACFVTRSVEVQGSTVWPDAVFDRDTLRLPDVPICGIRYARDVYVTADADLLPPLQLAWSVVPRGICADSFRVENPPESLLAGIPRLVRVSFNPPDTLECSATLEVRLSGPNCDSLLIGSLPIHATMRSRAPQVRSWSCGPGNVDPCVQPVAECEQADFHTVALEGQVLRCCPTVDANAATVILIPPEMSWLSVVDSCLVGTPAQTSSGGVVTAVTSSGCLADTSRLCIRVRRRDDLPSLVVESCPETQTNCPGCGATDVVCLREREQATCSVRVRNDDPVADDTLRVEFPPTGWPPPAGLGVRVERQPQDRWLWAVTLLPDTGTVRADCGSIDMTLTACELPTSDTCFGTPLCSDPVHRTLRIERIGPDVVVETCRVIVPGRQTGQVCLEEPFKIVARVRNAGELDTDCSVRVTFELEGFPPREAVVGVLASGQSQDVESSEFVITTPVDRPLTFQVRANCCPGEARIAGRCDNNVCSSSFRLCPIEYLVHNQGFTPNGDGVNDRAIVAMRGFGPGRGPREAVLDIYDFDGRLLRRLTQVEYRPPEHRISWDGMDYSGHAMPPGSYLFVLRVAGQVVKNGEVVVVR